MYPHAEKINFVGQRFQKLGQLVRTDWQTADATENI